MKRIAHPMRIIVPLLVAVLGAGIGAWAVATPAHAVVFDPLTITKTASDGDQFPPSHNAYYRIEVCNPNDATVFLNNITDTLPPMFSYNEGSSSGLTSSDPGIAGQTLTWDLAATEESVGGLQCADLNFTVFISADEPVGMYCNQASVDSDAGTSSTGPTAPIQVLNEGDTPVTPYCPGNQIVRRATATFTATSPATATEVPAAPTNTPVPPPPTATQPSGGSEGIISAPNTGSGPESGGPSILLLAIAGALVAGGVGAAAVAARRS